MLMAVTTTDKSDDTERHRVVVMLVVVFATGVIDAACLLHLGVFTAYITGSLILFGAHLTGVPGSPLPNACAVLSFMIGAFAGARVLRRDPVGRSELVVPLGLEAVLVLVAAVVAGTMGIDIDPKSYTLVGTYLTIAILALAMGVQLAAMRHANVPDLVFAAATVAMFNLVADSPLAAGTPTRTGRRVALIGMLLGGAVLGAGLARWQPWLAWAAAALVLAVAAVLAATIGRRPAVSDEASHPGNLPP